MNFRHVANQSILPKNDVPTTLPPFFGWNSTNPPPLHQRGEKKTLQAPPSTSPKASMRLSHCASSNKVSNRRTFTWTEKTAWTQSNYLDQIAYELCTEYFWIYWIYCMYVICECNTLWEMCIYIIRGIHSAGWIFSRSCRLRALGDIWEFSIPRSMSTHRLHPKRLLACICRYRCGSSTKTAPGRFLVSYFPITVLSFLLYLRVTRYRISCNGGKKQHESCLPNLMFSC